MQNTNTIKKSALAPTILIAGGAGFIGSHLAEVLLQKDARVVILDNFRTGKEIHVNHLLNNPKFALYDIDINQGLPLEIETVDYILHLAGLEEYLFSKDDVDLDSLLTNALGTKNLLDLAQRSGAKFLLASTIDVYEGKMSQLSIESYFGKTGLEETKYSMAEAKRYAEALVWEYHKKYNTDVRIVRLPEVYGPRMSLEASGDLGRLLKDLIEGRPFSVSGDGTKKEFYIYINDAISGMIKALLNENTSGNIFSLVPKEPISTLETAYLIRSIADRKVEIHTEETNRIPDPRTFQPDTYNLIYLKWDPKVSFKDGIVMTLNWFGYQTNEHAFKHAKLIDQKTKEKTGGIFSKLANQEETTLDYPHQQAHEAQMQQPQVQLPPEVSNQVNTIDQEQIQQAQQTYNARKLTETKALPKVKKLNKLKFTLPKFHFKLPEKKVDDPTKRSLPTKDDDVKLGVISKVFASIIVIFAFITVFIIFPGYKTYSLSKKAMEELLEVPELITQFDSDAASEKASLAYEKFTKAKRYYASLDWVFKLVGQQETYKATSKLMNSITYFSKVAYDMALTADPLSDIWVSLKPGSTKSFDPAALDVSKLHITDARNNLQLALADYKEVNMEYVPDSVKENLLTYEEVLVESDRGLEFASAIMSDLPNILGFDAPKKYIILFQNNNELRPTGGFIGSYAYLNLKEGRIEELTIDDIYNPDGQLELRNIRVTPPKPIGDFLTEDRLYIRNANWDPDFPRTATTIKDLLFKLNGESIDGMITVDLNLVANLLDVTGPIFLTAYNEEISSENLYERTQFHASYDFQEGSQQKRQFLTVLGSKLLESLFAQENEKTQDLIAAFVKALEQRHMQIHLFSSSLNAFLMDNHWTGSLVQTEGDYLQVVNANLGGTKSNYYVDQSMTYRLSSKTRDGLLRAELTLNYTHSGTDNAWPGGPYTNYVRVLTQDGSKLTGAKLIRDNTIEEDIFDSVAISKVDPYNSFETSFKLNTQSNIKVVLFYDLAQKLSVTKSNSDYSLYWQKQAGTQNDDYTFSFNTPFGITFVSGSNNLRQAEDTLFTSGKLNQDLELNIELD